MNELATTTSILLPPPRCEVSIRPAVAGDYPFIDRLQSMHSKALGFMPKAQLEGKISAGNVLVAWATSPCSSEENTAGSAVPHPIGYVMSQDRYFKRDDVGIVYQLNIAPGKQRHLVGARLIKEVFDRAAYGCKLFCCWCAQDLNANYFWEAMGFFPLAFRAGAKGKRAHIFWQKRIREGDTSTPFWYPCKTDGGMMREGRIVLPIPPGMKWSDEMPILLPEVARATRPSLKDDKAKTTGEGSREAGGVPVPRLIPPTVRRAQFGPPPSGNEPIVEKAMVGTAKPRAKKPKVKACPEQRRRVDPVHLAKARELRDRYLEQFNSGLVLAGGKYEVCKAIEAKAVERPAVSNVEPKMLAA